ncbi:MAG: hypothetical protein ACRDL0_09270 [Thermoleophilaceae bacterium]
MSDGDTNSRRAYEAPRVADYGTLADLTADAGMLMPLGLAGMSAPLVPTPPGGPDMPGTPGGSFDSGGGGGGGGEPPPLGGALGDLGPGDGGPGDGGAGESAPAGAQGGGGGGGDIVSTGGGDSSLPFTGFPAAIAAAVGAGLAGAGAALRRALGRSRV